MGKKSAKRLPATTEIVPKKGRRLKVLYRERCIGCFLCMYACARTRYKELSLEKSAIRVRINTGDEGKFSIRVCAACRDPPCAKACPEGALKLRSGGGVVVIEKKCTGCQICRKACVLDAIRWDMDKNVPIICIHCSYCVGYCPHNVLGMEEVDI